MMKSPRFPTRCASGRGAAVGLAVLLLLVPGHASAQVSVTISGGATAVDRNGTATGAVGAVRFDVAVLPSLSFEIGSAAARYTKSGGSADNLLLPEAGLRLTFPLGAIQGYVGAGGGANLRVRGTKGADGTWFGAVGLQFHLPGLWNLRAEARARSVRPGHMVDITVGFTRSLGLG